MRPDQQLDYAIFQLNSTRTRCELLISAQGMTYKLAAGLLHPFVVHLKAAEVQLAGGGHVIRLDPPDPFCAGWFTKGTLERFVRFVSTPEMLERISSIQMELHEIDKAMCSQSGDASDNIHHTKELVSKLADSDNAAGGMVSASAHLEKNAKESSDDAQSNLDENQKTTKRLLSKALEAQRMMLEKELEVTLARAVLAGFTVGHVKALIVFAETFGAQRLWAACSSLLLVFNERQQSGVRLDDLKSSVAETNPTDTGFSSNTVNRVGFREDMDLQGKVARRDNLRRASLPSEGKPSQEDSGLEKLTRRGSLDELTGDFLQVAAHMRASGVLEGARADRFNNWQLLSNGGSHAVSGEMHIGAAHLVGNIDVQDGRGHQRIAGWKGPPQSHPIQSVHPLVHGARYPSIPTSFGLQECPVPGYSYPMIPSGPYVGSLFAEGNGLQFSSPIPSSIRPHPLYTSAAAPAAKDGGAAFATPQKQEGNDTASCNNKLHNQPALSPQTLINEPFNEGTSMYNLDESHGGLSASAQISENDLAVDGESQMEASYLSVVDEPVASIEILDSIHKEPCKETPSGEISLIEKSADSIEQSDSIAKEFCKAARASELSFGDESAAILERTASKDLNCNKLQTDSSKKSSIDTSSNDNIQQTGLIQCEPSGTNELQEEITNDSSSNGNGEPCTERTRRLPVRSSSPSRRSASPLRKVQIGRSGSRRTIRGFNSVVQNISEKMERVNRDSSESCSEDNDAIKIEEELNEQPVRSSVQDVIGLFERKKDVGDIRSNVLRKDVGRTKSNNSVLKRWTQSGAFMKEMMEIDNSMVANLTKKGISIASGNGKGTELNSNDLNFSGNRDGTPNIVKDDGELMAACDVESSSKRAFAEQPSRKESEATRVDSDLVPSVDKTSNNNAMISETRKLSHEKACNTPVSDGTQAFGTGMVNGHQKTCRGKSLNDRQGDNDNEELEPTRPKKLSFGDEKAKLMQELLERRKAAWGNRTVKSNPLAEAQVRAEKLRAYKAGLQKSKQEKDEEEKKRIEDLKSQRKEKIAARGGPLGAFSTPSPASKQAPQTSPHRAGNRSSPTTMNYHKSFSSNSPRTSSSVPPSSLSPSLSKVKGFANNKLPRTPKETPGANENSLSYSAPSLSELKKESPKALTGLRSSTGSQRVSHLKKNLKDVDLNTSLKVNGHSVEEKRQSLPLVTGRKGIPPAKDSKNEGSPPVRKSGKGSSAANKQKKKPDNFQAVVKKPAAETVSEQNHTAKVETGHDKSSLNKDFSMSQENSSTQDDNGEAQINVPVLAEVRTRGSINDSSCLADGEFATSSATQDENGETQINVPVFAELQTLGSVNGSSCFTPGEFAASSESLGSKDLKEMEDSIVVENPCSDYIEGDHKKEDNKIGKEIDCSFIAQESQTDKFSEDLDASRDDADVHLNDSSNNMHASTDEHLSSAPTEIYDPPTEAYNAPRAVPTDSPLNTPKNLPRLLEAIQQAHSPDFSRGANGYRKMRDDSVVTRSSKDHHARGFKKLLFLGRKSSRSSSQNSGEWVTVSAMAEPGGGHDALSNSSVRSATSTAEAVTSQADKSRGGSFESSSTKGSRSFFSLSTFRGKNDGK